MVPLVATSPPTHPVPPAPRSAGRGRWLWVLAAVGLVAAAWRWLPVQDVLRRTLEGLGDLGPWGPVLFILVYVVAAVLLVPGSVLTLGAGAVFGVVWGSVYSSVAATLGATAAFLVGRHLARDAVVRRLAGHPAFVAIDRAVAEEGWKVVALTRLSPLFPYTVLNYAFGLTRVRLGPYVLASWIGMMPGTVLYVYLGSLAGVAAGTRARTPAEWVLYGVGGLATLGVTVLLTRAARRALAQRLPPGEAAP